MDTAQYLPMFLGLIGGVVHVPLPLRPLVELGVKDQVGVQHFGEDRDAIGAGFRDTVGGLMETAERLTSESS